MTGSSRYRVEDGRACIDIRLKTSQQLFDNRDPAPFRERDLDAAAVEYITASAQDIPRATPLRLVLLVTDETPGEAPAEVLVDAVRSHFAYERDQTERRLREHVRRGQFTFLVGACVLVLFITLAELTTALPAGHVRQVLREGLTITGWVAMWRPLDLLLYDWWPMLGARRRFERLRAAEISVRYGPDAQGAAAALPESGHPPASRR